jgi:hypothetical protein
MLPLPNPFFALTLSPSPTHTHHHHTLTGPFLSTAQGTTMGHQPQAAPHRRAQRPAASALLAALLLVLLAGAAHAQCNPPATQYQQNDANMGSTLCTGGTTACYSSNSPLFCTLNGDTYYPNVRSGSTGGNVTYFFSVGAAGGAEFVLPNSSWVRGVAVKTGTGNPQTNWCAYNTSTSLYPSPPATFRALSTISGVLVCMPSSPVAAAYSVGLAGQGQYNRTWTW